MTTRLILNEAEVEILLNNLCAKLGFCLPPDAQSRLLKNPPDDIHAFTDAVFAEEGVDPTTASRNLYRQVRDMVMEAFQNAEISGV